MIPELQLFLSKTSVKSADNFVKSITEKMRNSQVETSTS